MPIRFPLFPYNYLISRTLYIGDYAGNIRMIHVDRKKHAMLALPVFTKLGESEIQEKIRTLGLFGK